MSLCVTLRIKSLPLILRFRPHHPCRKTLNSLGASVRFRTPTRTRLLRAVCMLCAAVCVLQYLCALSYIYKGLTFKGSVCVCIALCKCARTCKPTMMIRLFRAVCVGQYACVALCACCNMCVAVRSMCVAVCVRVQPTIPQCRQYF